MTELEKLKLTELRLTQACVLAIICILAADFFALPLLLPNVLIGISVLAASFILIALLVGVIYALNKQIDTSTYRAYAASAADDNDGFALSTSGAAGVGIASADAYHGPTWTHVTHDGFLSEMPGGSDAASRFGEL